MLTLKTNVEFKQSRASSLIVHTSSILLGLYFALIPANIVLGQSPSPTGTPSPQSSNQVSVTISKDILIAILGSGALLAGLVALYRAKSDKRSVDLTSSEHSYEIGYKHGVAEKVIELSNQLKTTSASQQNISYKAVESESQTSTLSVKYESPEHPIVNLDLIKNYIQSIGLKNFLQVDENSLIFGIGGEEEINRTFLVTVIEGREVEINSFSVDLKKEDVKPSFLIRLLNLNSENKRGQIGLQARDDTYRVWVDQNLLLVSMGLSLETFRVNIFSLSGVHLEIQNLLKEEEVPFTQANPN
jgi:hypothetical protein